MARFFAATVLLLSQVLASAVLMMRSRDSPATIGEVLSEQKRLRRLSETLDSMVSTKDGALASSKVAPALRLFAQNLKQVLDNVEHTSNTTDAMHQLKAAKAGVSTLVGSLTHQQASLMAEDAEQRESLLLGVLLTRQKETMEKQLEVLNASDFMNLDVSKALRNQHEEDKPLYVQAAEYLDAHRASVPKPAVKPMMVVQDIADSLDRRVATLELELREREAHHAKKLAELSKIKAKMHGKALHVIEQSEKKEARNFKKWVVVREHDIATMKSAAEAVRRGDMKGIESASAALTKSMEALKNKNGGFVVLLSLGHQILGRDCPYCAAQCVEACHNRGEPYLSCLSECADAGKSL